MKTQVIKRFKDKHSKEIYEVGHEYEGEDKRVEELQSLGYLEAASSGEKKQEDENPSLLDGTVDEVKKALEGLPHEELEAFLEEEKADKNRKGITEYIESLLNKE